MDNRGFGDRMLELLHLRRMTQKDLARKTGITEAAVSHYIKGDRIPRSAVLARIAVELDTSSEYLMQGSPANASEEIEHAKRLIARNASYLTSAEKREIINLLLGNDE